MSTHIHEMEGTYHSKANADYSVERDKVTLYLTRFYNGKEYGRNLQITIDQHGPKGETSYIHLTEEQCKELGYILLKAFDDSIYPSE
jgi:hypothetical protein